MEKDGTYAGEPELKIMAEENSVLVVLHQVGEVDAGLKMTYQPESRDPTGTWHLLFDKKARHFDCLTTAAVEKPAPQPNPASPPRVSGWLLPLPPVVCSF
jgi:hypothetical protein